MADVHLDSPTEVELVRRPNASRLGYVAAIESVYALDGDDKTWLVNVLNGVAPVMNRGLGLMGYFWKVRGDTVEMEVTAPTLAGCPAGTFEALRKAAVISSAGYATSMHQSGACITMREGHGAGHEFANLPVIRDALLPLAGIRDFVVVVAASPDGTGVSIAVPARDVVRMVPRKRAALARMAAHIAAAQRLRRVVKIGRGSMADGAEAVLDARGKVLHAEATAAPRDARESLRGAVARMTQSRGPLRDEAPERAVALWEALVDGRWSVVERVDSDGKRLLFAHKNDPEVPDPRALSNRERAIAGWAALGHSGKLIAYELGLTPAAVSVHLRCALRKLGLRSRAELVQLFGGRSPRVRP